MTRHRWMMPTLITIVLVLTIASIAIGRIVLDWDVWLEQNAVGRTILLELRLPRALLGIVIGGALGLAGAALQGYLRNPLADPGTLGVSSMAALGAVLSIFFGVAGLYPWILPLSGVAGAVVGMLALFLLAGLTASTLTLVLSGVILSAISVAGIALVLSLSPSPWAAGEIVRWMLGALADRSLDDLALSTPLIVVGAILILNSRRALAPVTWA